MLGCKRENVEWKDEEMRSIHGWYCLRPRKQLNIHRESKPRNCWCAPSEARRLRHQSRHPRFEGYRPRILRRCVLQRESMQLNAPNSRVQPIPMAVPAMTTI